MSNTGENVSRIAKPWKRLCSLFTLQEIIFTLIVFIVEAGCDLSLDTPGALQDAMIKNYKLTSSQFSLFYSLYYVPSIVLNGVGGFFIDKMMGIKLSIVIYSIVGLVGVSFFALGGISSLFWLMVLGRLIFGLGNEMATGVCINYCIFAWYRNTVMNVAASLVSDGGMFGTLLIYQLGPKFITYLQTFMSEKRALDIVIIVASGTYVVTVLFAILLTYMKPKDKLEDVSTVDTSLPSSSTVPEERKANFKDFMSFPLVFWIMCVFSFVRSPQGAFYEFSQEILTSDEFGMTLDEANNAVTAMGLVSTILTLPVSLSVDKIGRNTWYIIASSTLSVVAHFLFSLRVNPYFVLILVGLSNTLFNSAYLPMYAYPVEKHLIGTCYGIVSVAGGICASSAPLLMGSVIDKFGTRGALYLLLSSSVLSLFGNISVWYIDKRSTGILSMSPKQRIDFERRMETETVETIERPS